MRKSLLVLAAGMGSRYGGLKQIDAIGPSGEAILDYSVYDALRAGFGKVVFVIREDIEDAFREHVGRRFEGRVEVAYAFQRLDDLPDGFAPPPGREKPWGTTHAILAARDAVAEPFLAINADDFYGREAYEAAAQHLDGFAPGAVEAAMVGYRLDKTLSEHGTVSRGLCRVGADGCLTDIEELLKVGWEEGRIVSASMGGLTGEEAVSMNMWLFSAEVFGVLHAYFADFLRAHIAAPKAEFFIPLAIHRMIADRGQRVPVLRSAAEWFGVTYREDKESAVARVRQLVADGAYPAALWV